MIRHVLAISTASGRPLQPQTATAPQCYTPSHRGKRAMRLAHILSRCTSVAILAAVRVARRPFFVFPPCTMTALLVFDLHGQVHRFIAEIAGKQFQGLRSAASYLRSGVISACLQKRLTRLDDAAAVLRRMSAMKCDEMLARSVVRFLRALRLLAPRWGRAALAPPALGKALDFGTVRTRAPRTPSLPQRRRPRACRRRVSEEHRRTSAPLRGTSRRTSVSISSGCCGAAALSAWLVGGARRHRQLGSRDRRHG